MQTDSNEKRKRNIFTFLIILIGYFFSLRYLFPGYFDPLLPHHTDQMDYYKDFEGVKLLSYIKSDRVMGDFILSLIGNIDYRSVLLFAILLTFLNMFLIIKIVENILNKNIPYVLQFLFIVLVFSQPTFYINYTYDVFSTISFTFVLIIIYLWYKNRFITTKYLVVYSVLLLIALLIKETFAITIIGFWMFQFIIMKDDKRKFSLKILIISLVILAMTLIRSKLTGSAFVSFSEDTTSPYFVSYELKSLLYTLAYYIKGTLNVYIILLFILTFILVGVFKKQYILNILMLVGIGYSAFIPYAVLPNHVVPHYTWLAVPLVFSIILFIPLQSFQHDNLKNSYILVSILILIILNLTTPLGYSEKYEENEWAIKPELINKNIYKSLDFVKGNILPSEKVLVTGLYGSEETWYKALYFVRETFDFHVDLTIVTVGNENEVNYTKLKNVNNINILEYDKIFAYNSQGVLLNMFIKDSENPNYTIKNEKAGVILFPELMELEKQANIEVNNWYVNMELGIKYLDLKLYSKAEKYLEKSVNLAKGTNPYPHFYYGKLLENTNKYNEAYMHYNKASTLEKGNPYFSESVERIEKLLN